MSGLMVLLKQPDTRASLLRGSWRAGLAYAVVLVALAYSLAGGVLLLRNLAVRPLDDNAVSSSAGSVLLAEFMAFAERHLPPTAAYLFQEPWSLGNAHRLRYALYPRRYERLPMEASESEVLRFIQTAEIDFVLVFDATHYPSDSWVHKAQPWLRRFELSPSSFILEIARRELPAVDEGRGF